MAAEVVTDIRYEIWFQDYACQIVWGKSQLLNAQRPSILCPCGEPGTKRWCDRSQMVSTCGSGTGYRLIAGVHYPCFHCISISISISRDNRQYIRGYVYADEWWYVDVGLRFVQSVLECLSTLVASTVSWWRLFQSWTRQKNEFFTVSCEECLVPSFRWWSRRVSLPGATKRSPGMATSPWTIL